MSSLACGPRRACSIRLPLALLIFLFGASTVGASARWISFSPLGPPNGDSTSASVSADGQRIAFMSLSDTLVSNRVYKGSSQIYVKDLTNGTIRRVSETADGQEGNSNSQNPFISADGRTVAFVSYAKNLTPNKTFDINVFVKDLTTGEIKSPSETSTGYFGSGDSFHPSLSGDGKRMVFYSNNNRLDRDTGPSTAGSIYVADLTTNTLQRVVAPNLPDDYSCHCGQDPIISADGKRVAFTTQMNLVPEDTNANYIYDVYVKDLDSNQFFLVSLARNAQDAPIPANNYSANPSLSADGKRVAFMSYASNLASGDTNATFDIFVADLDSKTLQRVSQSEAGEQANGTSNFPVLSGNGRWVAFWSNATNLVGGDTNNAFDVFAVDLLTKSIRLVALDANGTQANSESRNPAISQDGRWIAFDSSASNLEGGNFGYSKIYEAENLVNLIPLVQVPGPPLITDIAVSPSGPYAPGSTVTVVATISSRLPLSAVTALLDTGVAVPMTQAGDAWKAQLTLPFPADLTQIGLTVNATDSLNRSDARALPLAVMPSSPPPGKDWVFLVRGFTRFKNLTKKNAKAVAGNWGSFLDFVRDSGNQTYLGGIHPARFVSVPGMDVNDSYTINAKRLADFIHGFLAEHAVPSDRVYLIGHSTGGFVSRIYLKKYRNTPLYSGDIARVQRLALVGTPNRGTKAVDYIRKHYLKAKNARKLKKITTPLLKNLSVSGARQLNATYPHNSDDPKFSFVLGRYSKVKCDSFYRDLHTHVSSTENDGLVSAASVQSIALAGRDQVYPVQSSTCNDDLITASKSIKVVLAGLFGTNFPLTVSAPSLLQADPDDPVENLLTESVFEVPAGETLTLPLAVAGEKSVTVSLHFLDSGAEATLTGPNGEVVPLEQDSDFVAWDLGDPVPGDWTLTLQGMGIDGESTAGFLSIVTATAVPFTGEATPEWVMEEPVTLQASLPLGSYQAGMAVTATLTPDIEDAPAPTIDLHDDGISPDAAAGDGIFTASYTPTTYASYAVDFNATGKYTDGRTLARTASAVFEAYRAPGDLTGDGTVDGADLNLLFRIFLGLKTPSSVELQAGDVMPDPGTEGRLRGDGQITSEDLVWELNQFLGLNDDSS